MKTWVHLARKRAALAQSGAKESTEPSQTPQEQLARVQAENEQVRARDQVLVAENDKLAEKRDILRKATKYFAAETNWTRRQREGRWKERFSTQTAGVNSRPRTTRRHAAGTV